MLVVWGTRIGRSRRGRWADFCPICHGAAPFRVSVVYSYRHFYFIPVSSRDYQTFEAICETCGLLKILPWTSSHLISDRRGESLDELMLKTWPGAHAWLQERADLDRRAATRRLRGPEKDELIREVLFALEPMIKPRTKQVHVDRLTGVLLLLAVAGWIGLAIVFDRGVRRTADETWNIPVVFLCVMLGLAVASIATDARRFFKRRVAPLLLRGLEPLHLSVDDLDRVLGSFQRHELVMPRFIKSGAVVAEIERRELRKARGI